MRHYEEEKQNRRLRCEICSKAIFKSELAEIDICKECARNYPLEQYVYDLLK